MAKNMFSNRTELIQEIQKKFKFSTLEAEDIVDRAFFPMQDVEFFKSNIFRKKFFRSLNDLSKQENSHYFTKSKLLEYFIKDLDTKTLKVLEKLALKLESSHQNEFNIKYLENSFKKKNIEIIQNSKLIKNVESSSSIQFLHCSIQEKLASRVLELEDPKTSFQKYFVTKIGDEIVLKSSWFNVLLLLLESKNAEKYIDLIFEVIEQEPQNLTEKLMSFLLYTPNWNVSKGYKKKIFELIYTEYQEKRRVWLPWWDKTHHFIDEETVSFLKEEFKKHEKKGNFIQIGNIFFVIINVLQYNPEILDKDRDYWKDKFIEFAPKDEGFGVLARHALYGLAFFKNEPEILEKLDEKAFLESDDELKFSAFLDLRSSILPNDKKTIKLLLKNIGGESITNSVRAQENLDKISNAKGFKKVFEILNKDKNFRMNFVEYEAGKDSFLESLKKINDKELCKKIKQFILTCLEEPEEAYLAERSKIISHLTRILSEKGFDFSSEVLEKIENYYSIRAYQNVLAELVNEQNVEDYWNSLNKIEKFDIQDFKIILRKAYLNNVKGIKKVLEVCKLKKLLNAEGIKEIKEPKEKQDKRIAEKTILDSFKRLLNPSKEKYYPDVFDLYAKNHKIIEKNISKKDKDKLFRITKETWFKKLNPRTFKFERVEGNKYNYDSAIRHYGSMCQALYSLDKKYLFENIQKVIDFIPYAETRDLEFIKNCILENTTNIDWSFIDNVYSNKQNDLRFFNPESYVILHQKLAEEQYDISRTQLTENLKSFVEDKKLFYTNHYRHIALELLNSLGSEKDYFQKIFDKYKDTKKGKEIAIKANEILIKAFEDKDSILWRFKLVETWSSIDNKNKQALSHKELLEPLKNISFHYAKYFFDVLTNRDNKIVEKKQKFYEYYYGDIKGALIGFSRNNAPEYPSELLKMTKNLKAANLHNWNVRDLEEIRNMIVEIYIQNRNDKLT